jgi:hypothetical protein
LGAADSGASSRDDGDELHPRGALAAVAERLWQKEQPFIMLMRYGTTTKNCMQSFNP